VSIIGKPLAISEPGTVALSAASVAPTAAAACGSLYVTRHGVVVGLAPLAEDVGGDDPARVLADVGQRPVTAGRSEQPGATRGGRVRCR
jgi:hypothetical protein